MKKPTIEEELGTAQDPLDRGVRCPHINVIDSASPDENRQDDRITHYKCLDCGSYFPHIGDTDRWIVYVNPLNDR